MNATKWRELLWLYASRTASLVLFLAAAMKTWAPPHETSAPSLWSTIGLVSIEILLGSLLWLRVRAPITRFIAIGLFLLFSAVSFVSMLRGHSTCGCFGDLAVPPAFTFALDLAIACALFVARPFENVSVSRFHMIGSIACGGMIAALVLLITPVMDDLPTFDGKWSVSRADEVAGREKEFLAAIDIGKAIEKGTWVLLVYDAKCHSCREILGRLGSFQHFACGRYLANISVDGELWVGNPLQAHVNILHGSLTKNIRWSAVTPCALLFIDGRLCNTALKSTSDVDSLLLEHSNAVLTDDIRCDEEG